MGEHWTGVSFADDFAEQVCGLLGDGYRPCLDASLGVCGGLSAMLIGKQANRAEAVLPTAQAGAN